VVAASLASSAAWLATAAAEPTDVRVRIVGKTETLFEGPVLTEGHDIEASSDTEERPCDGVSPSDPENLTPGPTATAAAVDAMTIIGETFNGVWYPGRNDYLITRWGPQAEAEGESWWILVNDTLLDVGGCHYQLHEGTEVLWSFFGGSENPPLLALFPAGSHAAAPPLTATAELDVPFTVEVLSNKPKSGKPPSAPERTGFSPYTRGATVAPVQTAANGFERPLVEAREAVTTDAEGNASLTFTTTGWHRIMASTSGTVRSNRLDVCVPAPGQESCGQPPVEDQTRAPAGVETEKGGGTEKGTGTEKGGGTGEHNCDGSEAQGSSQESSTCSKSENHAPGESPPAGQTPSENGGQAHEGGAGTSDGPTAHAGTSASHAAASPIEIDGFTLMPFASDSPALRYHGHWRRHPERGALDGAIMLGAADATVTVTLAPGRPAFVLRDLHRTARVEVRAAGYREKFTLRGSSSTASRLLLAARHSHTGPVTLRVIAGTVGIDGVAVTR
jgi:hypothetical protein